MILLRLSRILTSAGAVHNTEEVDTKRDQGNMGLRRFGNVEAEPGQEETCGQEWKSGKQEVASTKSVDSEDCWDCKEEVDSAKLWSGQHHLHVQCKALTPREAASALMSLKPPSLKMMDE